jgi:diaminopimelate decarboxylase
VSCNLPIIHPREYFKKQDLGENLSIDEDGQLRFNGFRVVDFIKGSVSRCYVADITLLKKRGNRLKEVFSKYDYEFRPLYAVKANFHPQYIKTLVNIGFGVEVVNVHELKYVIESLNFKKIPIVCNGVAKHIKFNLNGKSLIEYAAKLEEYEDLTININSYYEAKELLKALSRIRQRVNVGLRINIEMYNGLVHEDLYAGAGYTRFGLRGMDIIRTIENLRNSRWVKITELHTHIGSQVATLKAFKKASKKLAEIFLKVKNKYSINIEKINFGGGLAFNYTKKKVKSTDYNEFYCNYNVGMWAEVLVSSISKEIKNEKPILEVEVGRWLTAPTMIYLVEVVDKVRISPKFKSYLKNSDEWLIVNGSAITDLPDIVLLKQWFEIVNASKVGEPLAKFYNIGGIACDSGDVFAWGRDRTGPRKLPETNVGDILAVLDVGAYQLPLSNNYNCLPKPKVFIISDKHIISE